MIFCLLNCLDSISIIKKYIIEIVSLSLWLTSRHFYHLFDFMFHTGIVEQAYFSLSKIISLCSLMTSTKTEITIRRKMSVSPHNYR